MTYEVTFADNTEVTLENMNDIAKDMGDTEFSEFSTNKFGVDALNSITSDLVSSGILRTEENAEMGCVPVIDGNNVVIGPGVVVFSTGAKLRITAAETFVKTNSTYIYAYNDHLTGLASIVISEIEPSVQMDIVPICFIDSSGQLNDLRSAAVAKILLNAEQQNNGITKIIQIDAALSGNVSFDVDIGWNGWKYILYKLSRDSGYATTGRCLELNDGETTRKFPANNVEGDYATGMAVTRNGSILHFEKVSTGNVFGINVEIEVR